MEPICAAFNSAFIALDRQTRELLSVTSERDLYRRPEGGERSMFPFSVGEYIIRSASVVEQAFGGITTRLWDDPYEWTLPEKLATSELIGQYLDDVDASRKRAMAFIRSDGELTRVIPAPERLIAISDILLTALARARHHQGRAFALYEVITKNRPQWL